MMHAFRRPSGPAPAMACLAQITAWMTLPAILALAAGCGGGSEKKPKQTAVAQADQGQDEEKDAAPAPPKKKKGKAPPLIKPAEPELPAPSTTDVRKWKLDDLNAALLRKDVQFLLGAMFYGASKPNDAKRAEELDGLVKKVAKLKDDPVPELPIPAGALAEADSDDASGAAAKPGATAGAPGVATPQRPGASMRMGGIRRGGGGGK